MMTITNTLTAKNGNPKLMGYSTIETNDDIVQDDVCRSSRRRCTINVCCERTLFFLGGIVFMILLSLSKSHIPYLKNRWDRNTEIIKELEVEEAELTKDETKLVQEQEEIKADAEELAQLHAVLSRERIERCRNVDWLEACERIGQAGARRRRRLGINAINDSNDTTAANIRIYDFMEEALLDSDDPAVIYDENCLRLYRLKLEDSKVTFPYHASQFLRSGGNQTMALFIQHGAMRDADHYFCSFAKLMSQQTYRKFDDILIIAPNFEYKGDTKIYPYDAFWNSTKVWVLFTYCFQRLLSQKMNDHNDNKIREVLISHFPIFNPFLLRQFLMCSLGGIGVWVHNQILGVVVIRMEQTL